MRAGELRKRITIERRALTLDAYGDEVEVWSALAANVPAKVEMMRGNETYRSPQAQEAATVTHRVVIRFRADVTPTDRLIYNGRILDILAVGDLDGRCRWTLFKCVERMGETV